MKINKKKGILFWVTGLSGSGKTSISKRIHKKIENLFGPTLIVSGDDLRNIFNFKSYSKLSREKLGIQYSNYAKFITDQKINIIFAVVAMRHKIRNHNRKKISNYLEIFIDAKISNIIKSKKKKIYFNDKKNIVGLGIKSEPPKKPHIIIRNDFKKSINTLSLELISKIIPFLKK